MRLRTFSHNFGQHAVPLDIQNPVIQMLEATNFTFEEKCASRLRETVLESLRILGWSSETKIQVGKGISITSMNRRVGLCLQTGNMSRFYADLLKLQTLYQKDRAVSGIYIIPTKQTANIMGDNLAHFERLTEELTLFKHVITMPLVVIGLAGEDD
jgi:hypothetical protein